MSRARVLAGVVVLVAFGAGLLVGWLLNRRQQSPSAPETSTPEAVRGPELFGVIEEARRLSPDWLRVRLACRPPARPEHRSAQSEYEGERRSVYIVHVSGETAVRQRAGGAGELAEGQTVSVWWRGEVATSDPPQVGAVTVVIERP
jgi:hypothetical protein